MIRPSLARSAVLPALLALGGCAVFSQNYATSDGPRRYRLLADFARLPSSDCLNEGKRIGEWVVRYTGYGCVAAGDRVEGALMLRPRAATSPDRTHAAMVVGPYLPGEYTLHATFRTARQLRQNSMPNPWEVAWLVWAYLDDAHFYYFIPKPDGWELGKRDPAYPGGQRFLATGEWSRRSMDVWQSMDVGVSDRGVTIRMDGAALVTFKDEERPYRGGQVAVYTEDAEIYVRQLDVSF